MVILELNAQNSVTIHGYHTATDFFRLQLPRDLVIRHPQVNELEAYGIPRKFIHAIAGRGGDLSGLPVASHRRQQDLGSRVEKFLWDSNLAIFFAALLAMLVGVIHQVAWYGLLLPIGFMLLSFITGLKFVTDIPNVHLAEFQDAMQHREILLMIDVPAAQVANVEELVHRHHPEAVVGGVGWNLDALQF